MDNSFFVFTDEAGAYKKHPSESFLRRHTYYLSDIVSEFDILGLEFDYSIVA